MKLFLFVTISLLFSEYPNSSNAYTHLEAISISEISDEFKGVKIGDKAPAFNLKNIDGKFYSFENISDANGNQPKGYIIIFTCNTCPVSKANEQRIIELHRKYSTQGYPIVAIQPNDSKMKPGDNYEAMQKNAKAKGFEFLYLIDEEQEVFPQYGATRTPEVYLADQDQIVRYHGAIDDSARDADQVEERYLENAIEALKAGKSPKVAETKAIGCGIKARRAQ